MDIAPTKISEALKDASFPATRDELVSKARANKADEEVVSALEGLPDETFESMSEVQETLAKVEA